MKTTKQTRTRTWREWYPSQRAAELMLCVLEPPGYDTRALAAAAYPSSKLSRYKVTVTVEEV
jgi:hypothetical protein